MNKQQLLFTALLLLLACGGKRKPEQKENQIQIAEQQENTEQADIEVDFLNCPIDPKEGILGGEYCGGDFWSGFTFTHGDAFFYLIPKIEAWRWMQKEQAKIKINENGDGGYYANKMSGLGYLLEKQSYSELSKKFDIYVFYTRKKDFMVFDTENRHFELKIPNTTYLYYLDFEHSRILKMDSLVTRENDADRGKYSWMNNFAASKLLDSKQKYLESMKTGKSVKNFVPFTYAIDIQAKGDLNFDGLEDIVVILVDETNNNDTPRPVLVLLGQPDGTYIRDKISWTAVEPKYRDDHLNYETEEISIDSTGVLQHWIWNLGPNINQTCKYKYIENKFCLIYLQSFNAGAGGQTEIFLNLLTSELVITECSTLHEDMPTKTSNDVYKINEISFESVNPAEIVSSIFFKYDL